jgi:hypothetical protein
VLLELLDDVDEVDDLLLDDALLEVRLDDDETDTDDLLLDDELLGLDIEDADETLVVLLDDTLDELEETDELLTLPVPAALDEPFVTLPPVQALVSDATHASHIKLDVDRHVKLLMTIHHEEMHGQWTPLHNVQCFKLSGAMIRRAQRARTTNAA